MKKLIVMFGLLMISFTSQAEVRGVTCDYNEPKQKITIDVRPGDQIVVSAPGNPSTGFRWYFQGKSVDFNNGSEDQTGGGGSFNFVFEVTQKLHKKSLTFEYRRGPAAPVSTCKLTLRVR